MSKSNCHSIGSQAEYDQATAGAELLVLLFGAEWHQPSVLLRGVLDELAATFPTYTFLKVEAEKVPKVSQKYRVAAVPTVVLTDGNRILRRLDKEVTAPKLVAFVKGAEGVKAAAPAPKEALFERLRQLTNSTPIILFMKGVPDSPRCGFSRQMIEILRAQGVDFGSDTVSTFDILSDQEVRQGLKEFSNWPTYPQLYISGKLVGGLDIVKDLIEEGDLKDMLSAVTESIDDRLKRLINSSTIMVFMKGSPDAPRCGFSGKIVGILDKHAKGGYGHFDILSDQTVRQEIKRYSNWPTFPQLYVKGALVGGLDIVKELEEDDELRETLGL